MVDQDKSNVLCQTLKDKYYIPKCEIENLNSCYDGRNTVFLLGRGIAGIPHFRKKSPKLSDVVRDKSPTLNHVAVLFKIV